MSINNSILSLIIKIVVTIISLRWYWKINQLYFVLLKVGFKPSDEFTNDWWHTMFNEASKKITIENKKVSSTNVHIYLLRS